MPQPILVCNEQNRVITLQLNPTPTTGWLVKLGPGSSQEIPSMAHYMALVPHITAFQLVVLDDEGNPFIPSEREMKRLEARPARVTSPEDQQRLGEERDLFHLQTFTPEPPPGIMMKKAEDSAAQALTESTLKNKTKAQLRELCLQQDLVATGTYKELLQRLTEKGKEE